MKRIVWNILWLCLLALPLTGCQKGKGTAATLMEAEALMYTSPDSALQMLEAIPNPERLTGQTQADYALLLTQARSRCRITATSDSLIRIATDYYRHSDDNARKAKAFLYLGDVYMDMKNHVEAMKALKQAEEVVEDADTRVQSLVYSNLGYLNRKTGNYNLAFEYYQKALKIDIANQSTEWIVSNLTNILNLPSFESCDSASFLISQLEKNLPAAHPDLQSKTYNNIGVYYEDRQQTELAVSYYKKAIQSSTSVPYRAYLNLAQIYEKEGNTTLADSLLQKVSETPIWATKAQIYVALHKRYLRKGNYQKAIYYMNLYQEARDSFFILRESKKIQHLQTEYDNEVFARKNAESANRLYRFAIITMVLLLLIAFIVWRFNCIHKQYQQKQLQQIQDQIKKINDLENEQKELKEEQEKKTEEIKNLNHLLKESRILNEDFLQSKGEWTSMDDIRALSWYIHLRSDLASYNPTVDYPMLCHWLNMTANGFANRVTEKHPTLKTSETTLCFLKYAGFSYSQIAEILHIKENSIIRYIYRICEGLNLNKSKTEFEKYLYNL